MPLADVLARLGGSARNLEIIFGEDGMIIVTVELFVVEQVDSMTRLVHRMKIDLPSC